jgi:NADH-quinone oxidoreductase subunit H
MIDPYLSLILFPVLALVFILGSVLFLFYSERKLSAFIQDRMGPTHVGKSGLLQPAADLLKLIQKETIVPQKARKFLFLLAPFLIFASVFSGFALVPLWPDLFPVPPVSGGLVLLLGVISIESVAILLASYASQSKFPIIGASRAIAQLVSYEVPLGITVLSVLWICGSADLGEIQAAQVYSTGAQTSNVGIFNSIRSWGGIFSWNIVQYPFVMILIPGFFISIMAESNRAPFDIPEGESEIIGGFHTEYSGFLWAIFFLAEYSIMLILSLVFCYLFLGGGASPVPDFGYSNFLSQPSFFWLLAKSWFLGLVMIWIRWTLPRLRVDQLMSLGWKVLTPISLIGFILIVLIY